MDYSVVQELLDAVLVEHEKFSFQKRLCLAIKNGIRSGRLASGLRLPASRDLSSHLGVARNSVLYAYDQLAAEGYLVATPKGTWVAQLQQLQQLDQAKGGQSPQLSQRGQSMPPHWRTHSDIVKPFTPGIPDVSRFPLSRWRSMLSRTYASINTRRLSFGEIGGEPELREALATHLRASRGVMCSARNVIITQGAQGALDLVARMLADPGDVAWVENPGYYFAKTCFRAAGLDVRGMPVDDDGARINDMDWDADKPRLVYLTPAYQYPLGSVLSMPRRAQLLNQASRYNTWVIEDDYDSELRYSSDPIPALHGLASNAPVIYVGTFSKTLLPVLRVGFLVVPDDIAHTMSMIAAQFTRPGHVVEQVALAKWIEAGHYARHIGVMRGLYAEKQRVLRQALHTHLPREVLVTGGSAGLQLAARFRQPLDDLELNRRCKDQGLVVAPLSTYYLPETPADLRESGMLLGYGTIHTSTIEDSVRKLRQVIDELRSPTA